MAFFCTHVYRAFQISTDPSDFSDKLYFLKYFAVSRGYNPFITDKVLKKFKTSKCSVYQSDPSLMPVVLTFHSSISLKVSKIFAQFGF